MNKANFLLISGILLIFTGCATNSHNSILGSWKSSSDEGGHLEFQEHGILISHMEPKPDLSKFNISSNAIIISEGLEVPSTWEFINNSDIVLTFEFSNETLTVTNSIIQISDDKMVMSSTGKKSTYSRIK